jgi:hypothetical protein
VCACGLTGSGWEQGIRWIGCGHHRVWSRVHKKNPHGFKGEPGVLDGLPQKDGSSAASRQRRGFTAVTRPAPQHGPTKTKTRQRNEGNGPWPDVGAQRRDGVAQRLGAGSVVGRRRRSRERERVGTPRCVAHMQGKQAGQNRLKTGTLPMVWCSTAWPWRSGGLALTTTEMRHQALATDGDKSAYAASGKGTRRVPKVSLLPRAHACATATHVAKATVAR